MILSMTGFGKAEAQLPSKKITIELKSLNSKQFDMTSRVPSSLREADLELRNRVATVLQRGKVDMVIIVEALGTETSMALNVPMMANYKTQIEDMRVQLGLPAPDDWYSLLMRFPDSMRTDSTSGISEDEMQVLLGAADRAIAELMAFRAKEGAKLADFFTERIRRIAALLDEVPRFEAERIARVRQRLEEGLAKIAIADYDRGRLEQEMIFYIEKLDINEEKQRLGQHLSYFLETLNAPEPGQGKKLGFIAQEMGREINTLGSKSNHAEMQRIVVKMKDELEQIKEQVLNVM